MEIKGAVIVTQTGDEIQEILNQAPKDTRSIEDINALIPGEASAENQLADKAHVAAAVKAEKDRAEAAEQRLQQGIDTADGKVATDKSRAEGVEQGLASRLTQAEGDIDTIDGKVATEKARAEGVEQTLQTNITTEKTRAEGAEATLDGKIATEKSRAEGVEQGLDSRLTQAEGDIDDIETVIPSQATAQNQLADKAFVNHSVATNTANFVGTFQTLAELQAVQNPTNNDYGFVIEQDAQGNEYYDRYKYNAASATWLFEYKIESTPFTAAQWAAIQSGITSALVTKLSDLPTNAALQEALNTINTTLGGKADKDTTYTKTQVDESQQAQNAQITAIVKALGLNPTTTTVALTAEQTDKAVTFNSERVASKSGYAVSAPVTVTKGKVYIIPMTATPSSDVSLVSHFEHRTFDQDIAYVYEHGEINGEDVITKAYAVYDMSIYYTYSYDAQGNLVSIIDKNGTQVQELPQTRTVTESYYIPLMEQGWTPAVSGSFLFVAPKTMQIVVSNQTAAVSGNITVIDLGLTENMGHNWLSKFDDQAEIEALGSVYAQLKAIAQVLGSMGDFECNQVSCVEVPKVQGQPMVVTGSGAPAAPVVPTFVGQKYLDVTNKKEYTAFSVTNSVSDWVLVN